MASGTLELDIHTAPSVTSKQKQNAAATEALVRVIIEQLQGPESPGDLKTLSALLRKHSTEAYNQSLNLI